jgi:hypothetical protein
MRKIKVSQEAIDALLLDITALQETVKFLKKQVSNMEARLAVAEAQRHRPSQDRPGWGRAIPTEKWWRQYGDAGEQGCVQ